MSLRPRPIDASDVEKRFADVAANEAWRATAVAKKLKKQTRIDFHAACGLPKPALAMQQGIWSRSSICITAEILRQLISP